ncbi:MAG: hypothetical protein VX633_04030 [Verrucomicrobiota bacterium]|nr:hypothetical protein [Verrucomicrobiota bacterium]
MRSWWLSPSAMHAAHGLDTTEVLAEIGCAIVIGEASFDWFLGGNRLPNT